MYKKLKKLWVQAINDSLIVHMHLTVICEQLICIICIQKKDNNILLTSSLAKVILYYFYL